MVGQVETIVSEKNTAMAFASGGVEVFATPMMIGMMEKASLSAVDSFLPEGYATVGTQVNVSHISATPLGMKVWAKAELIKFKGKALTFKVEAFDEVEKIGEGTHDRFIISLEKFIEKTNGKLNRG
ncbi:MAG TPA: thioesterase family protein [Eubacteriaceae bacterium]|nr:thioesterase family protein [Eubacteriaceae bacterium]